MKTRYKLTDAYGMTYNYTQWGPGMTYKGTGDGLLCGPGWIHVYTHPLLAVFLNPAHGEFLNPLLWECEVGGKSKTDRGLKEGWEICTTIKQITLPVVTLNQKIAFGILCVLEVYKEKFFTLWANNWLSGVNRASNVAEYVALVANTESIVAYNSFVCHAAFNAAYAAAYADHALAISAGLPAPDFYYAADTYAASSVAASAAEATNRSTSAVIIATAAATSYIDLISLAKQSILQE